MFATALAVGALLGGADEATIEGLSRLGTLMGKLIQIGDDMFDAMATPARTDWSRPRNNLAILFALEVEHPGRERLLALIPLVSDPASLKEAQDLLLRCGAISYCVYKFVETARAAQALIGSLELPNPQPAERLLALNVEPARRVLSRVGLDLPADLTHFPVA
jgi:geranylgeranyl diphosphate synthase type I